MTSFVDETGEWETRKISIVGALQSFLTQLTIGEDLTKISLPSVLLFPYSALELAASRGLNYTHYILGANRETDPVQRLIGITRWFMTYTQQEKLGKKPYNPILAETHIGWIDLSGEEYKTEGGPFKGYTKFFTEQVSHHPPITGYVMDNVEEGVHMEGNVEFSTAFHGNSVTAQADGPTYLDFHNHGERYIFSKTMPNIGIKNVILGTRRHSWEGEITISCEKSGLKVVLTYYEEGWYCVNTVSGYICKISEPNKKLYTIYGPLSGAINITSTETNKAEVLINLATIKKNKILYIPFDKLDHTSSVKLWRELSLAIVEDNMYNADIAKRAVEDAQRQRRRDNASYSPAYFVQNAETKYWAFDNEKWKDIDNKIMTAFDPVDTPHEQNTVQTTEDPQQQ